MLSLLVNLQDLAYKEQLDTVIKHIVTLMDVT